MPSVPSSPRGYGHTEETIMTEPVISVVGGTGAQGGGVVDALLAARKFKVRVASRNPSSDAAKALRARGAEVVKADLLEPSSLKAFYDGARRGEDKWRALEGGALHHEGARGCRGPVCRLRAPHVCPGAVLLPEFEVVRTAAPAGRSSRLG